MIYMYMYNFWKHEFSCTIANTCFIQSVYTHHQKLAGKINVIFKLIKCPVNAAHCAIRRTEPKSIRTYPDCPCCRCLHSRECHWQPQVADCRWRVSSRQNPQDSYQLWSDHSKASFLLGFVSIETLCDSMSSFPSRVTHTTRIATYRQWIGRLDRDARHRLRLHSTAKL